MERSRFTGVAVVTATIAIAALAATAGTAAGSTAAPKVAQAPNTIHVGFAVTKFVARGKTLVAMGKTITTYQSTDGAYSVTKPFVSRVTRGHVRSVQSASRICDVLNLTLGPLHLELLGLIVDLNRVVLTIKADSNGGLLGSLLCGLAGGSGLTTTGLTTTATQLTKVAQSSGLSAGPGFTVPISAVSPGTQQAAAVCTVLDLMLGPIDLNLLGLLVHLGGGATGADPVHLLITADNMKGILGSLLCGLAGGVPGG
jgi:hypothetical protein